MNKEETYKLFKKYNIPEESYYTNFFMTEFSFNGDYLKVSISPNDDKDYQISRMLKRYFRSILAKDKDLSDESTKKSDNYMSNKIAYNIYKYLFENVFDEYISPSTYIFKNKKLEYIFQRLDILDDRIEYYNKFDNIEDYIDAVLHMNIHKKIGRAHV
jgi:valyl-tRNA synthetase